MASLDFSKLGNASGHIDSSDNSDHSDQSDHDDESGESLNSENESSYGRHSGVSPNSATPYQYSQDDFHGDGQYQYEYDGVQPGKYDEEEDEHNGSSADIQNNLEGQSWPAPASEAFDAQVDNESDEEDDNEGPEAYEHSPPRKGDYAHGSSGNPHTSLERDIECDEADVKPESDAEDDESLSLATDGASLSSRLSPLPQKRPHSSTELPPPSKKDSKKKKKKKKKTSQSIDSSQVSAVKGLTIPFRSVKRTMKLDADIGTVQNEAAILVTFASELFLKKLAKESYAHAKRKGRNTIRYEDVADARAANRSYTFLDVLLP